MQPRRLTCSFGTLTFFLRRAVLHGIKIDGNAHRTIEGRLSRIVGIERRIVVHARRRQIVRCTHDLKVRPYACIIAYTCNFIIFLCLRNCCLRRRDVLLRCTQIQICRTYIETNLLLCRGTRLFRLAQRRLCRTYLRCGHAVVEEVPRQTQPRSPLITARMIVLKGILARN